jgi:hypothetical protein
MALPALAFFGVFALLPLGGGGGAEPDALGRHRRPELGRFEPLTPGQNFRPATPWRDRDWNYQGGCVGRPAERW